MNKNEEEKICRDALSKWGVSLQFDVAVEEMAELTKELMKYNRRSLLHGDFHPEVYSDRIAEETADVEFMLAQVKCVFNNHALVEKIKGEKFARLRERIDSEKDRRSFS